MLSVGIVGLPNAGKSTLFQALTQKEVDIAAYPFTTVDPNKAVVEVPDKRLEKLAKALKPDKTTPAVIEFIDLAGLIKDAHKGEGLGNQFLSQINQVDLILHVVRAFRSQNVAHPYEEINPKKDAQTVNLELILKDLQITKSHLEKIAKKVRAGSKQAKCEQAMLEKFKTILEQEKLLKNNLSPEERKLAQRLNLLTVKPILYLVNVNKEAKGTEFNRDDFLKINIKQELELEQLSDAERKEFTKKLGLTRALDCVIKACYNKLKLVTFFTIKGGRELRAWSCRQGTKAPQAAGMVHTDFQKNFIRAEVINWQKLTDSTSWQKAHSKGLVKTVGKDYKIKDGDVVEFKI